MLGAGLGGGEGQTEEKLRVSESEREEEGVVNAKRRQAALQKYVALRDQFFPEVPEISGEELLQLVEQGAIGKSKVLVDCRSDAERKVSIYKGAISKAEFEANADKYKNKEIIVYCAIGRRSGLFAKDLLVKFPDIKVRNHAGSVVDWTHVGGPFVDETTGASTLQVDPNTTWNPYLPIGKGLQVSGAR